MPAGHKQHKSTNHKKIGMPVLRAICEFVSNLQNAFRDLARVRIMVRVGSMSEICELRMRDFEIAQRILQIAQIHKWRATPAAEVT